MKKSSWIITGVVGLIILFTFISVSKNQDSTHSFCGGIAGVPCIKGYFCVLDNSSWMDSGGRCYKQSAEQSECQNGGGEWKQLNNACVDDCNLKGDMMCAQIVTWGCDCGYYTGDACWDSLNKRCVKYG